MLTTCYLAVVSTMAWSHDTKKMAKRASRKGQGYVGTVSLKFVLLFHGLQM